MSIHIHNCHAHIFTLEHVPEKFLPLSLVRVLTKYKLTRNLAGLLNSLNPFSNEDIFSRYAEFIIQGDQPDQESILRNLMASYPSDACFVILTMDFSYMKAGKSRKDFISQLKEVSSIKRKEAYKNRVFPFICADPRRRDVFQLVKRHILEEGFAGIKLYPPLGFYPFHKGLNDVYKFAEDKQIPILTHCSRGGIYSKASIKSEDLIHPKTGKKLEKTNRGEFTDNYTDPENYRYVLNDYPDLKICFGHFGGSGEWKKYQVSPYFGNFSESWVRTIISLMNSYKNVFADFSYTLSDPKFVPLLKLFLLESSAIKDRILFGSDFYMSQIEVSEYEWSVGLRASLGEDMYRQCAETNPKKFLGL